MKYLWTEDKGAGFHFWQLANQYLFHGDFVVESKGSNQGVLDAVRGLTPEPDDVYYIAFDRVYDNMDITCFEYIILAFSHLIEWTGTGRKDKIEMREDILKALKNHKIDIDSIDNQKTLNYLMGFKRYSTERVVKSLTNELTDGDEWSVKSDTMGNCWYRDCCSLEKPKRYSRFYRHRIH